MKEVISQVIQAEEEADQIKKEAQNEATRIIQAAIAEGRAEVSKAREAALSWGRDEVARVEQEISSTREQDLTALRAEYSGSSQNIDEIVDHVVSLIGEGR